MHFRHIALWIALIVGCAGTTSLAYWYFSATASLKVTTPSAAIPSGFRVNPEAVDFGTLIQGVSCEREIAIFNGTGEGWVVDQIIPSCGCNAGSVSSSDLKSNSQITLRVRFNSEGKFGEQKHSVRVLLHAVADPSRQAQISVSAAATMKTISWIESETVTFNLKPSTVSAMKSD